MVIWTDVAARDVERIAAYLSDEAPLRPEAIIDRILTRAESLESSPERGHTPHELRSIGDRTWREILESPWRIVYRIVGKTAEIHAVIDGRRSLADILTERVLDA